MKRSLPIWAAGVLAAAALAGCGKPAPVREPDLVFGRPGPHDGQFQMPQEVGFSPDGHVDRHSNDC